MGKFSSMESKRKRVFSACETKQTSIDLYPEKKHCVAPRMMSLDVSFDSADSAKTRSTVSPLSPTAFARESQTLSPFSPSPSDLNPDSKKSESTQQCLEYEYIEYTPKLPLSSSTGSVEQAISSSTLCAVLNGQYTQLYDTVKIIDCRFPFEYTGGHIYGAKNMNTWSQFLQELFPSEDPEIQAHQSKARTLVVLHCEFSQKRGPTWWSRIRQHDRNIRPSTEINLNQFIYPEMYVLKGGYNAFFEQFHQCQSPKEESSLEIPRSSYFNSDIPSYTRMSESSFSKQCAAGLKQFSRESEVSSSKRNRNLFRESRSSPISSRLLKL